MLNEGYGNHAEHTAGWTEDRIQQLKALWREGKSASQVATILGGGVTRNGVIGKVSRLKLTKRATTSVRAAKPTAIRYSEIVTAPSPKRHGNAGQPKAAAIQHRLAMAPAASVECQPPEHGVDVTRLLGLTKLNEHTCKWPHGDPLHPDFGFCGAHTREGSPYCLSHYARAHLSR